MDRCWKVINRRPKEALESDGFLAIERSLLEAIVQRECLAIKEADIFVAVDLWATTDNAKSRVYQPMVNQKEESLVSKLLEQYTFHRTR